MEFSEKFEEADRLKALANKLYAVSCRTFSLVDAFYFIENPFCPIFALFLLAPNTPTILTLPFHFLSCFRILDSMSSAIEQAFFACLESVFERSGCDKV
jgi:hypothetical protein